MSQEEQSFPLDEELDEADRIILGECLKSAVRELGKHLNARTKDVVVRGTAETRHHQAIVLGAMYQRLLGTYPPDQQAVIESYAEKLANLIVR